MNQLLRGEGCLLYNGYAKLQSPFPFGCKVKTTVIAKRQEGAKDDRINYKFLLGLSRSGDPVYLLPLANLNCEVVLL